LLESPEGYSDTCSAKADEQNNYNTITKTPAFGRGKELAHFFILAKGNQ